MQITKIFNALQFFSNKRNFKNYGSDLLHDKKHYDSACLRSSPKAMKAECREYRETDRQRERQDGVQIFKAKKKKVDVTKVSDSPT